MSLKRKCLAISSSNKRKAGEINLKNFPSEIIEIIIQTMDLKTKLSFAETNSRYRDIVMSRLYRDDHDDHDIILTAAELGLFNVVKYAHENGYPWNGLSCLRAAEIGNLEILKYFHENGSRLMDMCGVIVEKGHLECLKYLYENGLNEWDTWTSACAAENGHLEILKYLHENGCPWDVFTCERAAAKGHLEILKYAHENGCPWDLFKTKIFKKFYLNNI